MSEINSIYSYLNQNNYHNNSLKYNIGAKNNYKNNRTLNKKKNNDKKLKINSISELEFLYNDSQDKTTATNNNIKNKNIKKKNLIFSFKDKATNISSFNQNSIEVISPKNKDNKISRKNKKNKKNYQSHKSFDNFLENVNKYKKERESRINNLKTEILNKQNSEIFSKPKISKKSISLALNKDRDALFLKRPFSEEKNLDENFLFFYKINLNNNKEIKKEKYLKEKIVKDKYNKFYEDNIKWKKNKDEYNNKLRSDSIKKKEDDIKIYTFRPVLSENTLRIIKKMDKNKSKDLNRTNNLFNDEKERELLQKLKIRLKSVLTECIDKNNKNKPFINKKSLYLASNLTNNSISNKKPKTLNRYKSYQIYPKKCSIKDKKIIKPQKEENKNNIDENKYQKSMKRKYEYYLLQKFREMNNNRSNKKKELYKLNVRQETSWNQESVNKIIPKKKCGYIIKDLL